MALLVLIIEVTFVLFVAAISYLIYKRKKQVQFLKQNGIPTLGGSLSRIFRLFTGKLNVINLEVETYKQAKATKSDIVGVIDLFGTLTLYVTDPNLIQHILVKDFDHFANLRPIKVQKSGKYFNKMLFTLDHGPWKALRSKLSPTFTTGKIKKMFQIFKESSESLDKYLKQLLSSEGKSSMDLDISKILFKFSMDVIAKAAFGIDSHSWTLPPDQFSTFEKFGNRYGFKFDGKVIAKITVMLAAPKLADFLELEIFDHEAQTYLANVVREVVKSRRQNGTRQDDFLQLMMDVQDGLLKEDDEDNKLAEAAKINFDDDHLVANALLFFIGGFDTAQTVLQFTVYSLAREPEVQEKLFQEVTSVLAKHGDQLTYEALSDMTYLDLVMHETMRLYPASTRIERCCTQDFTIPGKQFVIKKGTVIGIPLHGLHMDLDYHPNPELFQPERHSPENKALRHSLSFIPFGGGPRSCPGNRFAWINIKAVIATLVKSYSFACCPKTLIPPEFDSSASAKLKGGMWLNITARD